MLSKPTPSPEYWVLAVFAVEVPEVPEVTEAVFPVDVPVGVDAVASGAGELVLRRQEQSAKTIMQMISIAAMKYAFFMRTLHYGRNSVKLHQKLNQYKIQHKISTEQYSG